MKKSKSEENYNLLKNKLVLIIRKLKLKIYSE